MFTKEANQATLRIYVHFPYSASSSTDIVSIRVRNFYKLFNGYNGITIKDYYAYSPYIAYDGLTGHLSRRHPATL